MTSPKVTICKNSLMAVQICECPDCRNLPQQPEAGSEEDSRAAPGSAEESEFRDELKGVRDMLRRECVDWAEDHTYAQTVAKRVGVPADKVEGDSYGAPGIQDLIDMIAERIPPNGGSER